MTLGQFSLVLVTMKMFSHVGKNYHKTTVLEKMVFFSSEKGLFKKI